MRSTRLQMYLNKNVLVDEFTPAVCLLVRNGDFVRAFCVKVTGLFGKTAFTVRVTCFKFMIQGYCTLRRLK